MEITGFECCFCKKSIEESYLNPVDINIIVNAEMQKSKKDRGSQNFYSHFDCLRDKLHRDIKGYLVANNDVKEALNKLLIVFELLRKLIKEIKNRSPVNTFQETIKALRDLNYSLLLLNKYDQIREKSILFQKVIDQLNEPITSIEERAFPVIDALIELDIDWNEKDPESFNALKELKDYLLEIYES